MIGSPSCTVAKKADNRDEAQRKQHNIVWINYVIQVRFSYAAT